MGDEDRGWWTETGKWIRAPFIDLPPPPQAIPCTTREPDGHRAAPRDQKWDEATRRRHRRDQWVQFGIRLALYVGLTVLGYAAGDMPTL